MEKPHRINQLGSLASSSTVNSLAFDRVTNKTFPLPIHYLSFSVSMFPVSLYLLVSLWYVNMIPARGDHLDLHCMLCFVSL